MTDNIIDIEPWLARKQAAQHRKVFEAVASRLFLEKMKEALRLRLKECDHGSQS